MLQKLFDSLQTRIRIDEMLLQGTNVSESIKSEYNSVTSAEEQVKNMLYQTEAHANKVISEAEGEAARLSLLQETYAMDPELTHLNIRTEGMTEVWNGLRVVFVDELQAAPGIP